MDGGVSVHLQSFILNPKIQDTLNEGEKNEFKLTKTKKMSIFVLLTLLLALTPLIGVARADTTYIYVNDNGWSDPTVGTWDPTTRTATLTQDLTATTIVIDASNIILDGNGHKITGAHSHGISIIGSKDVTLKNFNIEQLNF